MSEKKTLDAVVHSYVSGLLNNRAEQAKQATSDMVDYVLGKDNIIPQPLLDQCEFGHRFYKLPDHPKRDGKARCVHCLARGFDILRAEL